MKQKDRHPHHPADDSVAELERLKAECSWRREADAGMHSLATMLLSAAEIEEIAGLVLDVAKRLTGSEHGFCSVLKPENGAALCRISEPGVERECRIADAAVEGMDTGGLWGWVQRNKAPLVTNAPASDSRFDGVPPGHAELTNCICYPAVVDNVLVGQIALANSPGGYAERDEWVMDRLATIFSLSVQQHQTRKRLQQEKLRAEKASAAKTELLARVSHEMRTPLNGILGLIEVAQDARDDHDLAWCLESMRSAGLRILGNVERLVDYAEVEQGGAGLEVAPFALPALLRETAAEFATQAREKGLHMTCDVDPGLPEYALGDGPRLYQILGDLLGNAVRNSQRGTVALRAELGTFVVPDDGVPLVVRISDNGEGMTSDEIERAFEGFTGSTGLAASAGGLGIGLAMCRRFAELLGGGLEIRSEPGHGSECVVRIPLGRVENEAAKESEAASGSELSVLLAEDNEANARIVEVFMRRLGHSLHWAKDGKTALQALAVERFDVVFMDLEMAGIDGLETTRRIRAGEAGEAARNVPVVAMTAHAVQGYRERCAEAGMNDFLAKPLNLRALREVLDGLKPSPITVEDGEKHLEMDAALINLDGDRELMDELLMFFRENGPARLRELHQGLNGDDLELASRSAHSLKGNAATIGAQRLCGLAMQAHEALLDEAPDRARQILPALEDELRAVLDELDSLKDCGS